MALPRFVLKYELTAINDDGFMNPSPRPNNNEQQWNEIADFFHLLYIIFFSISETMKKYMKEL